MKTCATLLAVLTATGVIVSASAIAGPPPPAPPTQCTGTLSGPVSGDVVVPAGANCTIDKATISGNVNVQHGAALSINATGTEGFTTIGGNVKGRDCSSIAVLQGIGVPKIVIG